jgi:hypothetical protein
MATRKLCWLRNTDLCCNCSRHCLGGKLQRVDRLFDSNVPHSKLNSQQCKAAEQAASTPHSNTNDRKHVTHAWAMIWVGREAADLGIEIHLEVCA